MARYEPKGGIVTGSGTRVSRSIVQRAEALLRSLIGVSRAEVHVRATGGVERVRLVADGGLSNGQIVQNVRSALLAGLGIVLQPGQIEFLDEDSWQPSARPTPVTPTEEAEQARLSASSSCPQLPATARDSSPGGSPSGNGVAGNGGYAPDGHGVTTPRPELAFRLDGNDAKHVNGIAGNGAAHGASNGNGSGNSNGHGNGLGHTNGAGKGSPAPAGCEPTNGSGTGPDWLTRRGRQRSQTPAPQGQIPPLADRQHLASASARADASIGSRLVRLEGVDVLRQAGRLRCRVVLVAGGNRYSAIADCAEEPLAELQLAARVTCDALRAGDLTQTRFEAATVANLGGGMHVLVALSGWNRGEPVRRSGSAVIRDSAEQAAALAVLHALANS